ncbi:MAG: phosphoribosylformylglycinamidine cyclo-ligase, partial [Dehalococcoidia bacterium]
MAQEQRQPGMTYAQAGVDPAAADSFVARLRDLARLTRRPEVLAGVGPFAGLFRLDSYRDPVLVASVDGVGTKVKLAALLGRYDTVGMDLVNHCINDILTAGAHPLFFLDYIAASTIAVDEKVALVQGIVSACRSVGCALLGGETATMPDVYASGDFDLVGFMVGAVERDAVIDGSAIREGDLLLGLPSSGLHTNGYSLVRRIFGVGVGGDPDQERAKLYRSYPGLDVTLGEALLTPHRCYYHELKPLLPLLKGIAHITGGGLPGNVPRILPNGLAARLEVGSWPVQPVFRLIQAGNVAEEEMYRTFNMGLGMVLAVAPEDADEVRRHLPEALAVGQVVRRDDDKR